METITTINQKTKKPKGEYQTCNRFMTTMIIKLSTALKTVLKDFLLKRTKNKCIFILLFFYIV